jgi:antitoxin component YwqK of YwqJK toxin-antitoxin module
VLFSCGVRNKSDQKNYVISSYYDDYKTLPRTKYFFHADFGDKDNVIVHEYYQNGLLKTYYVKIDGKKEGLSTTFYQNGNLSAKVNFESGELDGNAVFYDKSGDIIKSSTYSNGKLIIE